MRRFTCPLTGMWPINTLRCAPRVCPFAGILENGIVRYTTFEYPNNISFACNPGFYLNGTSSAKCTEEGKWSPDIPVCARITCPPPPVPKFALLKDYKPSAGNNSLYEDTVVFKCLPHFAMVGNDTAMCAEHGNWTRLPECLEVKCPFPSRPENGYVNYPAKPVLLYKDKATFGCHETYKLDGPEEVECTKTGTWSSLPTCRASCKLPVKKATVLYQGMRVKIQEQIEKKTVGRFLSPQICPKVSTGCIRLICSNNVQLYGLEVCERHKLFPELRAVKMLSGPCVSAAAAVFGCGFPGIKDRVRNGCPLICFLSTQDSFLYLLVMRK